MNHTIIMYISVDDFAVSVTRLLHPEWHQHPLVITTSSRQSGVVHSVSPDASQTGVRAGMPMQQARQMCPNSRFVGLDSIPHQQFTDAIYSLLSELSPQAKQVAAGEICVDLAGCERMYGTWGAHPLGLVPFHSPAEGTYARDERQPIPPEKRTLPPRGERWITAIGTWIQRAIPRRIGLTVSVGCAANRLVARCASRLITPEGAVLVAEGTEERFMRQLSPEDIPGIGQSVMSKLQKWNVHSVAAAQELSRRLLRTTFGPKRGDKIYDLLRGTPPADLSSADIPQSICRERTFWEASNNPRFVEAMLHYLVELIGDRLRHQQLMAGKLHLKLCYEKSKPQRSRHRIDPPTDESNEIFHCARHQLSKRWRRNHRIRTIGVAVSNLCRTQERQTGLFAENDDRRRRLDRCVDQLRDRFGFDVLHRGPSIQLDTIPD